MVGEAATLIKLFDSELEDKQQQGVVSSGIAAYEGATREQ